MAISGSSFVISPSQAWLVVFLPALSYYMATRMASTGFQWGPSALGEVVSTSIVAYGGVDGCAEVASLFYLPASSSSLCSGADGIALALKPKYTLNVMISSERNGNANANANGIPSIVSSCWKHDSELGRGYLLLSQSLGKGRVWRWEVGGGPIAIGKTLHLEDAGCRSTHYRPAPTTAEPSSSSEVYSDCCCLPSLPTSSCCANNHNVEQASVGSGGIAIDFYSHLQGGNSNNDNKISEGSLVVAEWGERRIIRMEENGARTPLVIQVPDLCHRAQLQQIQLQTDSDTPTQQHALQTKRLSRPQKLLYTPFGDLLFVDVYPKCNMSAILKLPQAVHVQPLKSLHHSRLAHEWNSTASHDQQRKQPHLFFSSWTNNPIKAIGGTAVSTTWTSIYVTVKTTTDNSILLLQVSLLDQDQDEDEDQAKSDEDDGDGDDDDNLHKAQNEATGETIVHHDADANFVLNVTAELERSDLHHVIDAFEPSSIVVTQKGHIIMAIPGGIIVIDPQKKRIIGLLLVPPPSAETITNTFTNLPSRTTTPTTKTTGAKLTTPTSLSLGEDGFLYIFSNESLYRIPVKEGPVKIPTNLVPHV